MPLLCLSDLLDLEEEHRWKLARQSTYFCGRNEYGKER